MWKYLFELEYISESIKIVLGHSTFLTLPSLWIDYNKYKKSVVSFQEYLFQDQPLV